MGQKRTDEFHQEAVRLALSSYTKAQQVHRLSHKIGAKRRKNPSTSLRKPGAASLTR